MTDQAATALPRWRCHKEVYAAKILRVDEDENSHSGRLALTFDGGSEAAYVEVAESWLYKHNPQPGGYYVRYADGYESYSPSGAFEDGYTRLA